MMLEKVQLEDQLAAVRRGGGLVDLSRGTVRVRQILLRQILPPHILARQVLEH